MKNKITLCLIGLIMTLPCLHAEDSIDNRKIIYKPYKTSEKIIKSYNDTSTIYKYVTVDTNAKLLTETEGANIQKYILSKINPLTTEKTTGNVLSFSYNINEEGNVENFTFETIVTPSIDQQVKEIICSLKYTPAIKDNNNVSVEVKGSLNFPYFKRPRKVEVIKGSQWMPEYIGGESEMYKFIGNNLKYPPTTDQGRTVIRFTISEKGKITNALVLRSSGYGLLDEAAIKVVKKMPDWKPGLKDGKPVPVQFTLPIAFKKP